MASGKNQTISKTRQCIKDWIFTAIDQLKLRKSRPDRHRICYVLNKQFGVDVDAVNDVLEQMTDDHSIVRVDYKGSVSYRDIKNWIRVSKDIEEISMYAGAFVLNSDRASAAIQEAVKVLCNKLKTPTVTLTELEQYFRDKAHNKFTAAPLAVALQREVNAGHLMKSGTNGFSVSKPSKTTQDEMHRVDSPASDATSDGNDSVNDNGKRVKVRIYIMGVTLVYIGVAGVTSYFSRNLMLCLFVLQRKEGAFCQLAALSFSRKLAF